MSHSPLRILGIDPGTNFLGYGVLDVKGKTLHVLESGVLTLTHLSSSSEKLKRIFERTRTLILQHEPHELAIEAPFFGKNIQSMLKLGRAQGVSIAAALSQNIPYTEYAPRRIKQAVTGKGGATKDQVAAMLEHILKIPVRGELSEDASDALGVAVCHYYQLTGKFSAPEKGNSWSSFIKQNPKRLLP
ncbi:MAG: crossover junction endodeoxyribonuclease RuvC [Saprospiraceae bacterium]|nr:crossover junction endodeoxyribonuclease RuvC [Saprospiraceae bacterium]